jgi:L-arabinose isomerase
MLSRLKPRTAKIGIYAVGYETYWSQFEGLLDRLMGYHAEVVRIVRKFGVEVADFGMVDTSMDAYRVNGEIKAAGIDVLFVNMVTYATSATFAPIIRDMNVPVVLLALQPLPGLDYSQANTVMQLENDNICSVPEFTHVAIRMGKRVSDVVIGTLYNDPAAERHIAEWCEIAKVLHDVKGARLGLMGHVMEAMYDMHTDPAAFSAAFGLHVPLLEADDLLRLWRSVTDEEVEDKKRLILETFDTPEPKGDPVTTKLTNADLEEAAKASVALDKLVEQFKLTGLAYYYRGEEHSDHARLLSSLIVGNSLLNAQGIPMCGEYDIKTCLAMLIMDRLDIGGSFAEFHPFDFRENFILVGHDGPHHIAIADEKPILRSLLKYHGKQGHGASVEFSIKEGPITMLGITQDANHRYKFVIGEGYSQKGPIPPTGNTNTRGFFGTDVKDFVYRWVMEGPTHHFALGIGHHAGTLRKIADALGVGSVVIR